MTTDGSIRLRTFQEQLTIIVSIIFMGFFGSWNSMDFYNCDLWQWLMTVTHDSDTGTRTGTRTGHRISTRTGTRFERSTRTGNGSSISARFWMNWIWMDFCTLGLGGFWSGCIFVWWFWIWMGLSLVIFRISVKKFDCLKMFCYWTKFLRKIINKNWLSSSLILTRSTRYVPSSLFW